jgi:hypothetical protein
MSRNLAIGLGLLALSTSAQDTEVKGARVSVVRKPSAVLNVTIENRRESPLVEVQLGLTPRGTGSGLMVSGRYFGDTPPNETIKPHERRVLGTSLRSDWDAEAATIRLIVFADGYYEGVADAVEPWRKARQARIDDLRYWNGVFELMPRVSETDLRAYLKSRLGDRAAQDVQNQNPSGPLSRKLQDVLWRFPSGPDVWSGLDRLRADVQRELAALTRQPPGNAPPAAGAVTSAVIIAQERAASTALAAAIENLRDVSIETFGFEILDPASNRQRSGRREDASMTDPASAPGAHGRVQPHSIREVPLNVTLGPEDALPVVRLTFVIFDDLLSEGKAADRDEALRERESRAAELAFAHTALSQAVSRPATEILPFLLDKRAERARQLQPPERGLWSLEIDELIRQAKESPERLLANAAGFLERYERQRQRLLRHVKQ